MGSTSSILILNTAPQIQISIGADFIPPSLVAFQRYLQEGTPLPDVIVLPLLLGLSLEFRSQLDALREVNKSLQVILFIPDTKQGNASTLILTDVLFAIESLRPFKIVQSLEALDFETVLLETLEKARFYKQNEQLEKMIQMQKEQLGKLYKDLDEGVKKRQEFLEEVRKKTYLTHSRWQAVRSATEAIYQSSSLSEMESQLQKALANHLRIVLVRILLNPQDQFFTEQNKLFSKYFSFSSQLFLSHSKLPIGSVYYFRYQSEFSKEDADFLNKLSEGIVLAVERIRILKESENLKEQWESTFNAISDPVSLINNQYEIIQTNRSFREQGNHDNGNKCYQFLFNRKSPCEICHLGHNFRLENSEQGGKIFDVTSHPIFLKDYKVPIYMNQYSDITEPIKMEKKILETAKLAELGTIGSSIAHELNNPLGGILSFLQLIQMELNKSDPMQEDIALMEEGAQRCKQIIEHLLGFTRQSSGLEKKTIDLRKVVERALKIIEIQTRSLGAHIKHSPPHEPWIVCGSFNMISQATKIILQNLINRQTENFSKENSDCLIHISYIESLDYYSILFLDKGPGPSRGFNNSLELSIAEQIVKDHQGIFDITKSALDETLIKVTFKRVYET